MSQSQPTPLIRRTHLVRECGLATVVLLSLLTRQPAIAAQIVTAAVAGVVVDARTRQPLPGALVELGGATRPMATDAEGQFRFDAVPVGPQELVVSLVGYALVKQTVNVLPEGIHATLALTEGAAAFNEQVTVQGSVFGARELGVAGQQSLSSGELRQLGGMTLDDPLRAVQALSGATASDDLSGELAVRGNGFSDLNYTLDGAPARFLLHTLKLYQDGGSVSMINSDVLDHASLLRGAYPQRFDSRLGAALEFTSSDGSRERPRYNLTASGTSAAATADGPLGSGHGSWLVSGRQSYLDVFLKRILNDSSLAFGFGDLFSKVVYDLSDHHQLQATLVAGRSRFDAAEVQNPSRDLGSANHVGWLATGAWRHTLSPKIALTHRLFVTGETYDNRNGLDEQMASGRATNLGYRTAVVYTPDATRVVEAGWSIERLRTREQHAFQVPGWPIFGGEDFDARTTKVGAYGQVHWTAGRVTVTPGARVDHVGLISDWVASPWLQVDWRMSPAVTVLFNAGLHHQFPEFEQVLGRRGTATLAPERAMHVDAGLEGLVGTKTRWQVTLYDREERNLVDLPDAYIRQVGGVLLPESSTSHYDNRLKGTSRGVEVMFQRKASDALSGWIAYSFGRTRDTDVVTGERFSGDFDQRHTISLFGRYQLSDRMSINTRWRYGSNRPITGYIERHADGQYFLGASRNAARVPTYARWDARVDRTYRWSSRRLTVFGEVANILNRENLRQIPPFVDFRTGQAFGLFRTMFPIVPSVGATLEF